MKLGRNKLLFAVSWLLLPLLQSCRDDGAVQFAAPVPICTRAEVALGATPEAPPAVCSVPPGPVSAFIEAGAVQQQEFAAQRRSALLDPSRITVLTCGTGSPLPSARAQSCLAVFVNGQFLLFDAGDRAQYSMENLNLPLADLAAVFVTHLHSDHIADLGEVMSRSWILGRERALTIYGGQGIEQLVAGFNLVYAADDAYRVAHHGADLFPPVREAGAVSIAAPDIAGRVVYERDGVRVLAYAVDHSPVAPALGYRVEYAGRAVGISGDTIDSPGLRALAANADVLVSEAMNKTLVEDTECAFDRAADPRLQRIFRDIRSYHIGLPALAELANDASVATLVLTHLVPSFDQAAQLDVFFRQPVAARYNGELVVAQDGTEVVLTVR